MVKPSSEETVAGVTTFVPLTERVRPLGCEAHVTFTVPGLGDAAPAIGPTLPSGVVAEKE
jgi:hypothetical protein